MSRIITIAIATIFQNGGDATRALEIAKIIRDNKPKEFTLEIVFITRGSLYEQRVLDAGFQLYKAKPKLKGICYQDDFQTKFGELIGDKDLALELLQGEIEAYQNINPDLLIYGFWPIGSLARRLAIPNTPSIAFLPLPLTEAFLFENLTFPDELCLSRLPRSIQRLIMKTIPFYFKKRNPALGHTFIKQAVKELGLNNVPLTNVFDMLKSDIYLVNDLPIFYHTENYANNVIFTGPVYSKEKSGEIKDKQILQILDKTNSRKKIFCTLGTSGSKIELLEIVDMLNSSYGMELSGILLSPPSICSIEDIRSRLRNPYIYVTDSFIPAKAINEQVDLVICHGGQGTLQTSITSSVPLIGVATQPEQKINLEHLESFGSAIRIPRYKWKSKNIKEKVRHIFNHYDTYKLNAEKLCLEYEKTNSPKVISQKIWNTLLMQINDKPFNT